MEKPLLVFWKGEVVGEIHELEAEMFHLSGRWVPRESPRVTDFIQCFEVEEPEVIVGLGVGAAPSQTGVVYLAPSEFIELNIIPGDQ